MGNVNVSKDDDGDFCLEMWNGDKKLTIWINKDGQNYCFLMKKSDLANGSLGEEEADLHRGLEWIQESQT